jgi:6-phosphofructokinase 1
MNAFYAQSGGVTAVINATACAVIETARNHRNAISKVYAGRNGIIGALTEELIDTSREPARAIAKLRHTPGGAFGSCRYRLKHAEHDLAPYERLIEVFNAHKIGYFFYNGGNDSQDTALKVSELSQRMGYPLTCIGIPKTIDNDLAGTDCCPGFGSVAKYVAISTLEAALDLRSMARTSTKVFIFEVMGRHAGWIAAAAGLAGKAAAEPPHIILFPEVPFVAATFLEQVERHLRDHDDCVIVVSEGAKDDAGRLLAETGTTDAFGHPQLGGVAPLLAELIKKQLNAKCHWAVADYLQRSARHIASKTDLAHAYAVGKAAVDLAVKGRHGIMTSIVRTHDQPYRWRVGHTPLSDVANVEKKLPANFIRSDGFGITENCRRYLEPLIVGEDYPPYRRGIPDYVQLKNVAVPKRLNNPFAL